MNRSQFYRISLAIGALLFAYLIFCALCRPRIPEGFEHLNRKPDLGLKEDVRIFFSPILPQPMDDLIARRNRGISAYDEVIHFWGRVLDQHGKPVEGAEIKAVVATYRLVKVKGGYTDHEVLCARSAADGSFTLEGAAGFSLTIRELSKPGYVLPSAYQEGTRYEGERYRFQYKSIGNMGELFKAIPSQPVTFNLWKLKSPEVVRIINLPRGGPDLILDGPPISLQTISLQVATVGTEVHPEWELTIRTLRKDGGLVKADPRDRFMFEAPETGYTPAIKFRYGLKGANENIGDNGVPIRYFMRYGGGKCHAAHDFAIFAPGGQKVRLKIRAWSNPQHSRNLEHDGSKPLFDRKVQRMKFL